MKKTLFRTCWLYVKLSGMSTNKDHQIWRKVLGHYCRQRLPNEVLHHARNQSVNDFRKKSIWFQTPGNPKPNSALSPKNVAVFQHSVIDDYWEEACIIFLKCPSICTETPPFCGDQIGPNLSTGASTYLFLSCFRLVNPFIRSGSLSNVFVKSLLPTSPILRVFLMIWISCDKS